MAPGTQPTNSSQSSLKNNTLCPSRNVLFHLCPLLPIRMTRHFLSLSAISILLAPQFASAQTPHAPEPYIPLQNRPLLQIPAPQSINDTPLVLEAPSLRGVANAVTHQAGLAGHVLCVDATANIDTTATREGIEALVLRAKKAHINTLLFDVKPLGGEVLYKSKIAPYLTSWKGKSYDPNFDRLATVIEIAKANGISVFAMMNTFSDGHKLFKSGPGYARPQWQSVSYNVLREVQAQDGETLGFPSVAGEVAPLGQLSVLAPGSAKTTFKPDGISALVDASGKVVTVGAAPMVAALPMPQGTRVLTGAGAAGAWISAHLKADETVIFGATPSLVKIADAAWEKVGLFVSPHNPEVRAYETSVAREIAANYAIDGIVFDRMRYSGLATDFSDLARAEFEKTLGKRVDNWPADVFSYASDPFAPIIQGPLYKEWLEFRAATIQSFVRETAQQVRAARRGVQVGVYVGSWYSDYYGVGVNWASNDFNARYEWMTPDYFRTGYAGDLDWISTGCYYPVATRADARAQGLDPQTTVESAAALSNAVVNDVAFVYGALYLENYNNKPDDFARAIQVCKQSTQGVMIFDAVHLDQRGWWDVLERALASDAKAPDRVPELLQGVRATAAALKTARGEGEVMLGNLPPVPISQTP